ncbi:hypothetical protein EVAR_70198_1 [Eumeta japonica]|uniref:Reverse transcriptase domain-containing protein n=1 Tax=Eumeta variegata TaxID=151549 RepID=A0A4C1ZKX2_EUMVA|nr:hypothetical protein EVAR_70198_1 [Eumeta japonica]
MPGGYLLKPGNCLSIGETIPRARILSPNVDDGCYQSDPEAEQEILCPSKVLSLFPVLGQTVERMLIGRLSWHLKSKLQVTQFSFMSQRGMEDSLHDLMSFIDNELNYKRLISWCKY